MGFIYALAGENELAIQVNDAATQLYEPGARETEIPIGENFGHEKSGQENYHRNLVFQRTNDEFERVLLTNAQYGRVADLGCGSGLLGLRLRARSEFIVGVDFNFPALDVARNEGIYDRLSNSDMFQFLADEHEPFDLITANMAIDFTPKIEEFLQLAWSRLRPSGLLAFAVLPCGDGPIRSTTQMMGTLRWNFFDPEFVSMSSQSAGFHEIRKEMEPYQFSVGAYFLLQRPGD